MIYLFIPQALCLLMLAPYAVRRYRQQVAWREELERADEIYAAWQVGQAMTGLANSFTPMACAMGRLTNGMQRFAQVVAKFDVPARTSVSSSRTQNG